MSDHYQVPDPWDEVPEPLEPSTPEVQDPFRDDDDDFDYEAHYNRQPVEAAASIARPELADEISFFGVAELRGEQLSPELVTAMENFRNVADQYELKRTSSLRVQYDQAEAVAWMAASDAINRSDPQQHQLNRAVEIAASGGTARHVDESRRVTPATPVFDSALKARQEQISTLAERGSAGRIKNLLAKIRTTEKKNDVGLNQSDIHSLEQSRDRGFGRGR